MQGYDLTVSDGKEDIIKNIIAEKNLNYVGDLKLILEIHVVCEDARESLQSLIEKIRYFHGTNKSEDPEKTEEAIILMGIVIFFICYSMERIMTNFCSPIVITHFPRKKMEPSIPACLLQLSSI